VADEPGGPPPSEEELQANLEEALRNLSVGDVLIQSVMTVSSLGYRRLDPAERDLKQARLAIEALRALVPVLREAVPPTLIRDLNQTIANMQLAYATAVGAPARERAQAERPRDGEPTEPEPAQPEPPQPADEQAITPEDGDGEG
jgi:hypothetical protein